MIRFLGIAFLASCTGPGADQGNTGDTDVVVAADPEIPPSRLLTRLSMDLRGVRPTVEELDQIEANPDLYTTFVDDWLAEERFGQRIADLWAEVFYTRNERHFVELEYYEQDWTTGDLGRSVGEEPLQMLAWIATHDLPYTDFVTADWTMANEVLAELFPVDYPQGETGWKQVHYTDGRPAVGALVSNGLWWHYGSMLNNLNRGRANQVARIFLCDDFLARTIDFGTDQILNSEEALGDAIRTDPRCASCHDTLDPLASHFYGFWWYASQKSMPSEIAYYHPEREREWEELDALPPSYFGTPTRDMADLGVLVATDERFTDCAVTRTWELLLRQSSTTMTSTEFEAHRASFFQGGLTIKALVKSVVTSAAYKRDDDAGSHKFVTPYLLSEQVFDLTGYRWEESQWDLVGAPENGYLVLAGGADGDIISTTSDEPTVTQMLVQERLAQAAADFRVDLDFAALDSAVVLTEITGDETTADLTVVSHQIALLRRRFLGHSYSTGEAYNELLTDLWAELYDEGDSVVDGGRAPRAWKGVVIALLRDPDFVIY